MNVIYINNIYYYLIIYLLFTYICHYEFKNNIYAVNRKS